MTRLVLPDASARQVFQADRNTNFSVVAAAGAGKTTSIARRIASLAGAGPEIASNLFESLIVVTYTRKAAAEMQQRAWHELIERSRTLPGNQSASILSAFHKGFFGTIHSLCVLLLNEHGHALGLPAKIELADSSRLEDLWKSYLAETSLPHAPELFAHLPVEVFLELCRSIHPCTACGDVGEKPCIDPTNILALPAKGSGGANILRSQDLLRHWQESLGQGKYSPLPQPYGSSEKLLTAWQETFQPLSRWVTSASLPHAVAWARKFLEYRIRHGVLTYQDQITLACDLFSQKNIRKKIRTREHRILLDEAQDTDPEQFRVLIQMAQRPDDESDWFEGKPTALREGFFSMVGDPQQLIYPDRADITFYADVRKRLVESGGRELTFHTTMRCSQEVVSLVNQVGPKLLHGEGGQASFVPLDARPDAATGQVVSWQPEAPPDPAGMASTELHAYEATRLALWLRSTGFLSLGTDDWGKVAILCPQNKWLAQMARGLRDVHLPYQIHSARETRLSAPFYRWLYALAHIFIRPDDTYEIAGVLRQIMGVSDQQLAHFCQGNDQKLILSPRRTGSGDVAEALSELSSLRIKVLALPIRTAVEMIGDELGLMGKLCAIYPDQKASLEEQRSAAFLHATQQEMLSESFETWVDRFSTYLEDQNTETVPRSGAIQLISCNKAKGLEWDCVILPYLAREIRSGGNTYPKIRSRRNSRASVILDSFWAPQNAEPWQDAGRQNDQRLLYVSLTRARKTLVLVDDSTIYTRQSRSFISLFGENFPATTPAFFESVTAPVPAPSTPPASPLILSRGDVDRARNVAGSFMVRTLPHDLHTSAESDEPDDRTRDGLADAALNDFILEPKRRAFEYGLWWHELVQFLPWSVDDMDRLDYFTERLATCPDAPRARAEWTLFEKSGLIPILAQPEWILHTEMPMLHGFSPHQCVEGIIDLAAFHSVKKHWLLVDWKTDLLAVQSRNAFIDSYRGQLMAYRDALVQLTGFPVKPSLYATRTGEWHQLAEK